MTTFHVILLIVYVYTTIVAVADVLVNAINDPKSTLMFRAGFIIATILWPVATPVMVTYSLYKSLKSLR